MLPRLERVLFPGVVLGALGCAGDVVPIPIHADTVQSTGLAQLLIEQLPALRSGPSFASWKQTHPSDRITLYSPEGAEPTYKNWCIRAEATLRLDSISSATRTVYFYPPTVPDPPVLPTAVSSGQLVEQCRPGFVWVEARERDAERITRIMKENVDALSAVLGAVQKDVAVTWAYAAAWQNTHFWRSDEISVAVASTDHAGWKQADRDSATRVLVIAAGPMSSIDLERKRASTTPPAAWLEQEVYRAERLRNAIALADADVELTEAMLSFVGKFAPGFLYSHSFTAPQLAELVDLLLRWIAGTAELPVEQRAAALVAADLFMIHFRWHGAVDDDEQSPLRQRLQAQGADFGYSTLGTAHFYTRSWVKEARRLDPDGAAGELAFLLLMETGFETNLCQDQGGLGFRAVIEQGEAFLRTKPRAPIAGDVHLMVAQAYADIVTLAGGGGWGYADSTHYVAEAQSARARAVEHYQAAFERTGNSFRTRHAWPTAWRLMAGLIPTSTFFFCIYD